MSDSTWRTRPQPYLLRETEQAAMRRSLQSRDWVAVLAVLATIDMGEEPKALDLICDLIEARVGGAGEAELQAWGERARAWLLRLIGQTPEAERRLAN